MNKFGYWISSHRSPLKDAFENAIRIAIHDAHKSASPNSPQEPDVVAKLMLEAVPYICSALRSVLVPAGITTKVSSVFCHQRPMVEFVRSKDRCELGDILFVHQHRGADGSFRHNALLLQAKMSAEIEHSISASNELVQLTLYRNWPEFEYYRTLGLSGQSRDVVPKTSHLGAQYLLIDDSDRYSAHSGMLGFPGSHCMAVCAVSNPLHAYYSLADELVDFLLTGSGRLFYRKWEPEFSDWSQVVWDILSYAKAATFNRKNINIRNRSRQSGDQIQLFCSLEKDGALFGDEAGEAIEANLKSFFSYGDQPPNEINLENEGEFPGGVSVVLIETAEQKE